MYMITCYCRVSSTVNYVVLYLLHLIKSKPITIVTIANATKLLSEAADGLRQETQSSVNNWIDQGLCMCVCVLIYKASNVTYHLVNII